MVQLHLLPSVVGTRKRESPWIQNIFRQAPKRLIARCVSPMKPSPSTREFPASREGSFYGRSPQISKRLLLKSSSELNLRPLCPKGACSQKPRGHAASFVFSQRSPKTLRG